MHDYETLFCAADKHGKLPRKRSEIFKVPRTFHHSHKQKNNSIKNVMKLIKKRCAFSLSVFYNN